MKALKWLIGIVVALLALIVLAIVLLVNFINPNDYRDQIGQAISKAIHKPFVVQGDIGWVVFPTLGFKVQNMMVGKNDGKDLYAKINALEINLQILPLLHKKIELNALKIDGAQVVLPANANDNKSSDAATNTNDAKAAAGSVMTLPALSLSELSVEHVDVAQLDAVGKTAWTIKNLSLESTNLRMDQLVPLQMRFDFNAPAKNFAATIRFASSIEWRTQEQQIYLKNPKLFIDNDKNSAQHIELNLDIQNILVDLAQKTIALKKISGDLNQLNFAGNVMVKAFDTTPEISGDWNMDADNLKAVLNSFGVTLPKMQGSLTALGNFSFKTNYQYANNQLTLNPLTLQFDKNMLTGSVKSSDVKSMAANVSLQGSHLTLGDYLSPAEKTQTVVLNGMNINLNLLPPAGADKNWLASMISGTVALKDATYNDIKVNNAQLQVDGKSQVFKLNKLHLGIWQGMVDGTGQVDLQGASPKISMNPVIQNIQIHDLLEMVDPKIQLTGVANLSGNVSTAGSDAATMKRNLSGAIKTQIKNGVLHGINLNYWVNVAAALIRRESLPAQPAGLAKTEFGTLTATLNINNGIISNQDLFLQGPIAQAKGQGTIDLNRESLNYRLQIAKTNQATGKAHQDVVPLIITGTFDSPNIQPDMTAITKAVLNNQKDQLVNKLVGDKVAKSQVGQQINDALGKLLG